MAGFQLRAEPRSIVGKKVRFLRRQGIVPGNIYGNAASSAIQVSARDLESTIRRAGRSALVTLDIAGGEPATVLMKEWQRHPFKGDLLHVDFFRVLMTETLKLDVPIRLIGEAPAVKQTGGMILQSQATLSVECLPGDIPDVIEADVSGLEEIDASIYVRDLAIPAGVTVLTDGDELVVRIMAPTVQAETDESAEVETVATAEGGSASDESAE